MQRCGLLGRKLGHSYSPAIHRALGGGYSYELFEVEPENLSSFLERRDFHGLNVTIPYKKEVIPFCGELSRVAAKIGSVNTLLRRPDGSLFGDNTDASGFLSMVKRSGIDVQGKKALVLGGGGSSLTVCYVLSELGAGEIVVISRGGENNYENLNRHRDAQVLVNTTPVGMYPDTDATPVSLSAFTRLEGVLDLIYNPARTRLLMDAQSRDLPRLGGLTMLVGQARAACELFSGQPVDEGKERSVIRELRRQTENIILIGMPGCGKSTIGQRLAGIMDRPFVDADHALEADAGLNIPEIFQREGEEGFRERETRILKELGKRSGLVISTGGGCVNREENYFHLRQNGTVIFLERSLHLLAREGRPLSGGDLEAMYECRLPLYRRFADRIIQNDAQVETVAKNVLEAAYEAIGD